MGGGDPGLGGLDMITVPGGGGGQGLGIATLCRGLWDMTTESVASLAGFRWDKSEATC